MGNEKSIRHIIGKYLKGKATPAEKEQLFSFYKYIKRDQIDWEDNKHGKKEEVGHRILEDIQVHIENNQKREKRIRRLSSAWKVAAAVVLLCGTAIWTWNKDVVEETEEPAMATIQPGSDQAVLQLADGRTVYLDSSANGKLSTTSGSTIHLEEKGALVYAATGDTDKTGEMNTITVPKGGQFKVVLADGTSVWLNASSSLSYPTHFAGAERRVKLVGEAYFDVSKRVQKGTTKRIPFIVETDGQVVEVLGTSFNINAYTDEKMVRTTLITGAVKIQPTEGGAATVLKPGEQSTLADGRLTIQQVNTYQSIAWKQGDFSFEDMPLEEIMRQIARWYNVDVGYQGEIGKVKFGGSISRSKDIQEVLDVLSLTGVHFDVKGRRIMVIP